jgi:hypothetical protein
MYISRDNEYLCIYRQLYNQQINENLTLAQLIYYKN